MPLLSPKELSPEDRTNYRRCVGGLYTTYGVLLVMFVAFHAYKSMTAPIQSQTLGKSNDVELTRTVGPSSTGQPEFKAAGPNR
jgi:hypothetical protein